MSIQYCDNCNKHIDTDFNAEHFDECGVIETYTDRGTQFDGGGIKNDIKPEQIPY